MFKLFKLLNGKICGPAWLPARSFQNVKHVNLLWLFHCVKGKESEETKNSATLSVFKVAEHSSSSKN